MHRLTGAVAVVAGPGIGGRDTGLELRGRGAGVECGVEATEAARRGGGEERGFARGGAVGVAFETHDPGGVARTVQHGLRSFHDRDPIVGGGKNVRGGRIHPVAAAPEDRLAVDQDAEAGAGEAAEDGIAVRAAFPDDRESRDAL
jgi:hypothetical protein